jgi:hypothetical protein
VERPAQAPPAPPQMLNASQPDRATHGGSGSLGVTTPQNCEKGSSLPIVVRPPVQVPGKSPPDVRRTKVARRGLGQGVEGVCHGAAPAIDALLASPLILDRA